MFKVVRLTKYAVIYCSVFLLSACEKETPEAAFSLNQKLKFNESEYHEYFKDNLAVSDSLIYPSLSYLDTLKHFYSRRNYKPLFIKSFEEEEFINSLLVILSKAGEHGLDPAHYHYDIIQDEFLKAADTSAMVNRYAHLANAELFTADAILKYSYHLRYGVVDPKLIFSDSYFLPSADSSQRNLFKPLMQENIISYLSEIQPKSLKYAALQAKLKNFLNLRNDEWNPVKISKRKIVPGDRDSSLIHISERLISFGFLDTSKIFIADFSFYDTLLVPAVKRFQKMHGLNEDGIIGAGTVERFNITPDDYINKIKASLERFRWFDYSGKDEYILVNIPDFHLYVMKNGKEMFTSRVCTGRKRSAYYDSQYEIYKRNKNWRSKPEDWETPVMSSEISHMVLNPTWTVPANIIREEIAGGLRKDSMYLQKKNFKIFKNGMEVAAAQIQHQELTKANIPYSIVQDPGYLNALGKIKFMFNNPFGIYLHDTPSKSAFNLDNRAVSHGCVRVEKPLALSEFLLAHQSKWNIDYLKTEIGSPVGDKMIAQEYWKVRSSLRKGSSYGKTTEVRLDKKVPVYVDYYTAWVDKDGEINFRDDVYKKDVKLIKAMETTYNIPQK